LLGKYRGISPNGCLHVRIQYVEKLPIENPKIGIGWEEEGVSNRSKDQVRFMSIIRGIANLNKYGALPRPSEDPLGARHPPSSNAGVKILQIYAVGTAVC
jgi:hypothetical protein